MIFRFRGGIHPKTNKLTHDSHTVAFPLPEKLFIPLSQHIGKPAFPCVNAGDIVKKGSLIGIADGDFSANVYSSACGTVENIVTMPLSNGNACKHVVIKVNGNDEYTKLEPLVNPDAHRIIERIKEAGIVGMGGATFPTHIKLAPKNPVDTLIINGAECEPYITCDYRVIIEHIEDFIGGILIEAETLNVKRILIGIERINAEAVKVLRAATADIPEISVAALPVKYPQGSEKQLIYALTKRVVPQGKLPSDVGVAVSNVQTAYAIKRAVSYGEPLIERVVTISGDIDDDKRGNYIIPTGVTVKDIADYVSANNYKKIISGGPMMGFALSNMSVAVTKGSSAILFFNENKLLSKPSPCINCARCARACPLRLMPMYIDAYASAGELDKALKYGAMDCFECGSCAYVCPAKRPLVQAIRLAKKTIKEKKQ